MQIAENTVVSIEYTLRNSEGEVLDTSEGREPLSYLHGHGQIIPGLEKALEGGSAGDELSVNVPPEEGYGSHQAELVQQVPMSVFSGVDKVEPGMQFQAESSAGPMIVTVKEIADDTVTVDGNHALAGQELLFSVTVQEVREATEAEISEGQA